MSSGKLVAAALLVVVLGLGCVATLWLLRGTARTEVIHATSGLTAVEDASVGEAVADDRGDTEAARSELISDAIEGGEAETAEAASEYHGIAEYLSGTVVDHRDLPLEAAEVSIGRFRWAFQGPDTKALRVA